MPNDNLDQLSDEELMKMAGGGASPSDNLDNLSDEELMKMAGSEPAQPTRDKRYLVTPDEEKNIKNLPFMDMLGANAKLSYQEGVAPILEGTSTAMFGLPRAAVHKLNPDLENKIFPEQIGTEGKIIRGVSEGAGFLGGGASKLAKYAGSKVVGNTLGRKLARGAAEGFVAGGSQVVNPDADLGQQAKQAGAGAAGGMIFQALGEGLQSVNRATKGAPAFARKVREAFAKKRTDSFDTFEKDVDALSNKNPDKTIPLHNIMSEAAATGNYDTKLKGLINSDEQLRKLVNNPEMAKEMPLGEVQVLVKKLNKKIQGKYGSDWIEAKDFVHDIKAARMEAFPEMAEINAKYAETAEPYRLIKSKLKEGALLKNLGSKFGDPELNLRAESLMTKDLKAEVDNYRRTRKLLKVFGAATGAGVLGAGATKLFK